jgi:hypothetical protein
MKTHTSKTLKPIFNSSPTSPKQANPKSYFRGTSHCKDNPKPKQSQTYFEELEEATRKLI